MCYPLPQPCFWHSLIFLLDHHNNPQSCQCLQVTESAVPSWACLPPAQISALQFHLESPLTSQYHLTMQVIPSFPKSRFHIGFCVLSRVPSNSWLFLLKQLNLVNQLLLRICNTSPEVLMTMSLSLGLLPMNLAFTHVLLWWYTDLPLCCWPVFSHPVKISSFYHLFEGSYHSLHLPQYIQVLFFCCHKPLFLLLRTGNASLPFQPFRSLNWIEWCL